MRFIGIEKSICVPCCQSTWLLIIGGYTAWTVIVPWFLSSNFWQIHRSSRLIKGCTVRAFLLFRSNLRCNTYSASSNREFILIAPSKFFWHACWIKKIKICSSYYFLPFSKQLVELIDKVLESIKSNANLAVKLETSNLSTNFFIVMSTSYCSR